MQVTARYRIELPFVITFLEGEAEETIELDLSGVKVIIYPLIFRDSNGKDHERERPKDNNEIEESLRKHHIASLNKPNNKNIFSANVVCIDVIKDTCGEPPTKNFIDNLDSIAFNTLRHFLEISRWRASAYWIDYNCTPCFYYSEYVDENDQYIESSNIHKKTLNFFVIKPVGIDSPITGEIWNQIRDDLKSDCDVPIQQNLLLNAKNFISLKNYRLAIIEAVTALEIAIANFVRRSIDSNSAVELLIDKWLRHVPSPEKLDNVIELLPCGVKNELENQKSEKEKKLKNKCISAIEMRNKIVHEGKNITSKEINRVSDYVNSIERMVYYLDNN